MMSESAQELKDYANKRIPLPKKDLSLKDNDLLKKVSLLAQAVEVDKPPLIGYDVSTFFKIDPTSDKRAVGG